MDLGRLCARLATPMTEVKSMESGKVDVLNIEDGRKMVTMLCTPNKDRQDPLQFLEELETDMVLLNENPVDGADCVSPVVMAKFIDKPETLPALYRQVSPTFDALQTVLEAPGIREHEYWHAKVQVCHRLPGAGKTGKGGIQVTAWVLVTGVKVQ